MAVYTSFSMGRTLAIFLVLHGSGEGSVLRVEGDFVPRAGTGTDIRRKVGARASSSISSSAVAEPVAPTSGVAGLAAEAEDWEVQFSWGLHHSKLAIEADDGKDWVTDAPFSGAAVPRQVLHAEELLEAGANGAPDEKRRREKTSERALRMYYHAKWLAERNFAKAAEWRYREAARLAKSCRRSVLAAHALSRLGYFLMYWGRREEARDILSESERLHTKSNPLAPFLLGVLDRQAAGDDPEKLKEAEDRIIAAAELPSQELEADHHRLIEEIRFWRRAAEETPRHCLKANDVAHILICLVGHAIVGLKKLF